MTRPHYDEAGPGGGLMGRIVGGRGDWEKSKSESRLPRMAGLSKSLFAEHATLREAQGGVLSKKTFR